MCYTFVRTDYGGQLDFKSSGKGAIYFTDEGHGEFLLNVRNATFRFNPEKRAIDIFKNGHFRIEYPGERIAGISVVALMRMEYEQLLRVAGYTSDFKFKA